MNFKNIKKFIFLILILNTISSLKSMIFMSMFSKVIKNNLFINKLINYFKFIPNKNLINQTKNTKQTDLIIKDLKKKSLYDFSPLEPQNISLLKNLIITQGKSLIDKICFQIFKIEQNFKSLQPSSTTPKNFFLTTSYKNFNQTYHSNKFSELLRSIFIKRSYEKRLKEYKIRNFVFLRSYTESMTEKINWPNVLVFSLSTSTLVYCFK